MHRQLVAKMLWVDRADLRCAMSKASSSLGRPSTFKNIQATMRFLRGNPGVMTVPPMQFSSEAAKRSLERSVLTLSDSVWASDSERHSVSVTASGSVEDTGGTPSMQRARKSRYSLSVVVKLRWLTRYLERAKEWD